MWALYVLKMNWVYKLTRWAATAVIFLSSFWIAYLSLLAHGFTKGAVERIFNKEVKVSLATEALSSNWQVLIVLAILYFLIGMYLVLKVKKELPLFLLIALSVFLSVSVLNIVVVSAGFELV